MTAKKLLYPWIIYVVDGAARDGILFLRKQTANGRLLNMRILG